MKTNRYCALDDIGFVGIPNKKHTEKYYAAIGKVIAEMREKRQSNLRSVNASRISI